MDRTDLLWLRVAYASAWVMAVGSVLIGAYLLSTGHIIDWVPVDPDETSEARIVDVSGTGAFLVGAGAAGTFILFALEAYVGPWRRRAMVLSPDTRDITAPDAGAATEG